MLTLEEYKELQGEYLGYCIECKKVTADCCEPDARKYECPECGKKTVYGIEECLVMGLVN